MFDSEFKTVKYSKGNMLAPLQPPFQYIAVGAL